ncbi:SRPBCC family protein [Pseudonocardia oroxyli]|uniref:Polyketide cyclase / dehydrase and lipid transport n=1 Tax=Pseudonocardia oroxyli TaxID=366584 RepID=A0A1G7JCD2_PSEOR|nr:SRPBCC family protein [Pseudonocardia oroxyli]SDF22543.1 Polyketide cyclase / dehydrase and lipid transport [Pseudonocardia oroxyli]
MSDRIEVTRVIAAEPAAIFAVLRDPKGHVDIDASGMLQSHTGEPASAVGDSFTVHMDREALGDMPELGRYDVEVHIETYEPDRAIAWSIVGLARPPLGHVYGYTLEPVAGGTRVTSYYDWSAVREDWKHRFPIVPESALKATLGILARTVRQGS